MSAPIGSPCVNETLCAGGSLCREGFCICANGEIVMDGKCTSEINIGGTGNLLPGSPCEETAQCAGGAQCRDKLCICLPGSVIQNGVCVSTIGGCKQNVTYNIKILNPFVLFSTTRCSVLV